MFVSVGVRLRALLFRDVPDAELDEELAYHLERDIERNIANGMTHAAARDAARRAFGNTTIATEEARDAWRWRRLEALRQDISFALRTFRRAPLFVVGVTAAIGLGLGLMATAFTLFDSYVLRPVAVRDPYALFDITWRARDGQWHAFTWDGYVGVRSEREVLADAFAFENLQVRINGQPMMGQFVTANYFDLLGVPPAFGRTLTPSDESAPGSGAIVVLSHRTWRLSFGGDSGVIGKRIRLNGVPLQVVGIAREGFGGLSEVPFDFWAPLRMAAAIDSTEDVLGPKHPELLRVVGRLAPGATVDQLRAAVTRWVSAATNDLPPTRRVKEILLNSRATPIPLSPQLLAVTSPLFAAFALVLLIACANVANMMLARGMARQREITIRLALGAGRERLIRQLLTESMLLSVPAALLGFLVSRAALAIGIRVMFATAPKAFAPYLRPIPLETDTRVLLFMGGAAVLAALVFGLAPALQATKPSLIQGSRGDFDTQLRPSRLRNALVLAQITVSVLLVICAGVRPRGARKTE